MGLGDLEGGGAISRNDEPCMTASVLGDGPASDRKVAAAAVGHEVRRNTASVARADPAGML